jgi:Fuc2NAc and GlcNAc transferase
MLPLSSDVDSFQSMTLSVLLPAVVACVSVLLLTRLVIAFAMRGRWWESLSDRSSHVRPTLSRGGIGFVIFLTLALPIFCGELLAPVQWVALLACAASIALVGYLDDARPLPVLPRLIVHLSAAAISVWVLWPKLLSIDWVSSMLPPVLVGIALVLLWVWFINFFNFMDGIDGIAAAEVVFIGVAGALLSVAGGHSELASAWALLAGACLGFLVWNAPPARIFMGDVGSGFLGFVVAALLLLSVVEGVMSPWVALLLVATFIGDATVTLLRRMWRAERWYEGHRQHAYQQLAIRWDDHGKVTTAYTIFNLAVLAPAAWLANQSPALVLPILIATLTLVALLVLLAGGGAPPAATRRGDPSV